MYCRARGFTLIEVLITILVGAILTSIAVKGFGLTSSELAVRQAKNVFTGLVARARAQAVQDGTTALLIVDTRGDSVTVRSTGDPETQFFGGEMEIDLQSSSNVFFLCMTPRGFANPNCNSFNTTIELRFVQGPEADTVEILPMGQVR